MLLYLGSTFRVFPLFDRLGKVYFYCLNVTIIYTNNVKLLENSNFPLVFVIQEEICSVQNKGSLNPDTIIILIGIDK